MTAPFGVEALGLNRERLLARAKFFQTYAAMAHTPAWPDPPEPAALVTRLAGLPRPGAAEDMIPLEEFDRHGDTVREAGALPERREQAADALRQAGICLLPIDPAAARQALLAAADQYSSRGRPFGVFLTCVCSTAPGPARDAMALLSDNAPHDPLQQMLLLLAAAGHPDISAEYEDRFADLAERAPASDWATIGPGGQPVARWWRFGLDLAEASWDVAVGQELAPDVRERLLASLKVAGRAHGTVLRGLAHDTYHWKEAHLRVDLIDLFVAGATCLLLRLHPPLRDSHQLSALDAFDAVSVAAGAALAATM